MIKAKRTAKVFTLSELLALAAVIGILAAIALPAYSVYTAKGRTGSAHGTSPEANAATTVYSTKRDRDAMALRAAYPLVHTPTQCAAVSVDETGAITVRLGAGIDAAQGPDKTAVGASLRLHGRHVQCLYEVLF